MLAIEEKLRDKKTKQGIRGRRPHIRNKDQGGGGTRSELSVIYPLTDLVSGIDSYEVPSEGFGGTGKSVCSAAKDPGIVLCPLSNK